MELFKLQNMKTHEVRWAKDRHEIQELLGISKPTTCRLMKDVSNGEIGKSGKELVSLVEVEVKEVVR